MHGPSIAVLLVVATLGLASPSSMAGSADAIAEARRKLSAEDGIAAVAILEEALPGAAENKESVLTLLQQAYEVAARQATRAGHPREAETYRENLKILNRKSRPAARTQPVSPAQVPEPGSSGTDPESRGQGRDSASFARPRDRADFASRGAVVSRSHPPSQRRAF